MNYQEAINEAEIQIDMYESMILYNNDFEPKNDNSNYERKLDFLKTAISAMQELQEYKQKLHDAYGECEDLLETVVDGLVKHQGLELGTPIKSRILTDEDVDLWEGYKQIGTLVEVREAMQELKLYKDAKLCLIPEDVFSKQCEEVDAYREIGTLEEVKDAMERQQAKKPNNVEAEGYRYTKTYRCPTCGGNFSGTGIANYCYHCGQKLDWEEIKE